MAPTCRLLLPETGDVALLQLPLAGLEALRAAAESHFSELKGKDYVVTDTGTVFDSDADVKQIRDGTTLVLASAAGAVLAAPVRERISFQPHPKTLTMAGEFEYFAAQGRHPFVYALAEFVDNSLRATRRNAPRRRAITVSLVVSGTNPATACGLVAIQDNGCGMNKHELGDWAVMNLSMEERGAAPQEPTPAGRGGGAAASAGRFLTGDLSFFGVGSKNAGFFMGSSIKVATKRAEEPYVHELCLAAADLEARYAARQEVYVEDMVHRNPADGSTLTPMEQPFAVASSWVASEGESEGGAEAVGSGTGPSFTRVVIGDLKPDVLQQIMDDEAGTHICQELAHLYHYYLHGGQGNRGAGGSAAMREGRLPNGEPFPDIVLRYQVDARLVWEQRLAEVEDDMETKLLRAQQAELPFTLQVPDKGIVCGVLYYYPFQNDQETVPVENLQTSTKPASSPPFHGGRGTQAAPTQLPRGTQAPPRGTQLGSGGAAALDEDEEAEALGSWQLAPIFEAFWQGRLIPGARIDTLPFVEAVRSKRNAQAKDVIPDEAFRRLRGALFFGPAFRVTRNKLLFRDNLADVLAGAVPGERQMEAKFRQWLQRCHATLDKSVRFEALADGRTQAALRAKLGEDTTAFERITDGIRTVCRGDVVRINAKPQLVGRVQHFTIPQVVREEGAYANGQVHIELLPAELHGSACKKQFSLRRVEEVMSETEQQDYLAREMLKVASSLRVEPMRFATGQALEFAAGDTIPETTVSVLNGAGQRILKLPCSNERITVAQRLWRLPPEGQAGDAAAGGGDDEAGGGSGRAAKRQRKGKKARARHDENADANDGGGALAAGSEQGAGIPASAELLLTVENKTPNKETFQFARISDGLQQSGRYILEFVAAPAAPGQPPLRAAVALLVKPGSPCSLSLSGEGKAVAALQELALGEALPALKVMFADQFGNPVALSPTATPPSLAIAAALPSPDGGLQATEELTVLAQQAAVQDGMLITGLQLLGSDAAAAAAEAGAEAGLALLSCTDGLSHPTARQAQAAPSRQSLPVAEVLLRVSLAGSSDLEAVTLPLRLRAGAPRSLRPLPGHPWQDAGEEGAVKLQHGGVLPPFQVAAFDAWGNPTAPSPQLGFSVLAECEATGPDAKECGVSALGIATVEGLTGATSTASTGPATLRLSLKATPSNEHAAAAVAAADPTAALTFPLAVEPSQMPASLQLIFNGQPLQTREVQGEDGVATVAVLEGVPAGSPSSAAGPRRSVPHLAVSGLRLALVDESGAPAAQQVSGRVTVSFRGGGKSTSWTGESIKLPPGLKAPDHCSEVASEWVRFSSNDPPLVLETALEVHAVPAAPDRWALSLVDQLTSQNAEEVGVVQCGQQFVMEVEALDAFNNRCAGGGGQLPQPTLVLESEGPLQYDEAEWEQGWVSQGGEQVYTVRMRMSGHPGTVRITVRDSGGEGSASVLTEDTLAVELRAGPAAQLTVEGPATIECGTKATLPQLRVRVCDAAGNPTTSETFEVSVNSSALATDGSGRAAHVAVEGGNKIKVKKGVALLKDVRVAADEAGSYALRVQSASRKVAVGDAVLHLVMQPLNAVTDLRLVLPETLASGDCAAGTAAQLNVEVLTENGLPLPPEVAAGGLILKVMPPGGSKSTAVTHHLPAEAGEEGMQTEEGLWTFQLAELTVAGTYAAVAEYVEQRPELAAGLSKKEAMRRSASVRFEVQHGQPVTLRLEAASLPDRVAVTNGSNTKQRLVLRNAAVQLLDSHGNAASGGGVQVRFRLRHLPVAAADGASELPELGEPQAGMLETDDRGRAFVGDLCIAEGSGRATNGALECELLCEALGLYPCSAHELETDNDGWAVCWSCPVLFSDDAARFAHIERLNQERGQLAQRRDELARRLDGAQQALQSVQQEQQRVHELMASKEKGLGLGGPAPSRVRSAEKALAAARRAAEAAAGAEAPEALEARYGLPTAQSTASIDRVLQSGDPGLVGVFAQLATVDDPALSAVLATNFRGVLPTVVLADKAARQRLSALLAQRKLAPPDMLPLTMLVASAAKAGDSPGFAGASEHAHVLQRAACRGTDPPLALPLPHTKAINVLRERADGVGMAASDWPIGCLGYACNLVRPLHRGHRASLLANLLGGALVFERLKEAEEYREFLSMKLKVGAGTILTLDGRRITSQGIVSGASFRVIPVEQADVRFGGSGAVGEDPTAAAAAEQVAALEEWVELLRSRDQADAAAAEAQAEAQQAEAECRAQLEEAETQLAELEAQLALGDMMAAPAAAGGGEDAGQRGAGSGRKRRARRQQQDEAEGDRAGVTEEHEQEEAEPAAARSRRRRRE